MWKIIPNSSCVLEPEELRYLKQLLAKNICNCKICKSYEKSSENIIDYHDKQIQVTEQCFFKEISRAVSAQNFHQVPSLSNTLCPGCYMALNLSLQKDVKIFKDEEVETKTEMFSCDKSTEKAYKVAEKSTSHINQCEGTKAIVSFDEVDSKLSNGNIESQDISMRKEPMAYSECKDETPDVAPIYNCHCISNFINSIRPPLRSCDIYNQ